MNGVGMTSLVHVSATGLAVVGLDDPVIEFRVAHPPVNALEDELVDNLLSAFDMVDARHRVVVISSGLERIFFAGGDLKTIAAQLPEQHRVYVEKIQTLVTRIRELDQPVISQVHGHCLGGGLEIALAGDLIVASDDATAGLPEVTLGILAAAGGVHHLVRRVGEGRARLLLLLGRSISSSRAAQIGLFDEVVPREDLPATVAEIAEHLASLPREAVAINKALINKALDRTSAEGLAAELESWLDVRRSGEAQHALDRFVSVERRRERP